MGIPSICVWYYPKFRLCATSLCSFISFFVWSVRVIEDSQSYCILYSSFKTHLCQLHTASIHMSTHKRYFYSVRLFVLLILSSFLTYPCPYYKCYPEIHVPFLFVFKQVILDYNFIMKIFLLCSKDELFIPEIRRIRS